MKKGKRLLLILLVMFWSAAASAQWLYAPVTPQVNLSDGSFRLNFGAYGILTPAPLNSPHFTGTPIAPTPTLGDSSKQLETSEGLMQYVAAHRQYLDTGFFHGLGSVLFPFGPRTKVILDTLRVLNTPSNAYDVVNLGYFNAHSGSGSVTSVSGTTNRITSTGGATPVIDISSTFEALLGKVASPLSQFSATTSAQLAGVLSDESGTGVVVYTNSPVLITPNLGTPSALVATNATGTAAALTAGNVTTDANLTGPITSVGNATTIANINGVTPTYYDPTSSIQTQLNGKISGNQSISFAPTGDVTGSTTGTTSLNPALSIGAGKVVNSMIAAGTIDLTTKLSATGTPSSTTYLRGDNTWATVSSGGLTSANFVYNETLGGTPNGSTTAFTIANSPTSGTVEIYRNGMLQLSGTDYTQSGTSVTYLYAPLTGDVLKSNYLK